MVASSPEPRRVLIAEDEPAILLSVEYLMREAGYEVLLACDGAAALEMAVRQRPHLLILDVMLPEVDGFEVSRRLRAHPDLAGIRILMLTARGQATEATRGLAAGADAYMTKPFSTKDLVETVSRLLAQKSI